MKQVFLKELTQNKCITVTYEQDGMLQKCQGRIYKLDLYQQLLALKNKNQKHYLIHLNSIRSIN